MKSICVALTPLTSERLLVLKTSITAPGRIVRKLLEVLDAKLSVDFNVFKSPGCSLIETSLTVPAVRSVAVDRVTLILDDWKLFCIVMKVVCSALDTTGSLKLRVSSPRFISRLADSTIGPVVSSTVVPA